jgi:hypothetical protein
MHTREPIAYEGFYVYPIGTLPDPGRDAWDRRPMARYPSYTLRADFATLDAAHIAIHDFIVNIRESYRVTHSDRTRYIVACRDTSCKFTV